MFDLHVHTTASDGEYSPKDIVRLAKKEGLKTIAITDHDTIDGVLEGLLEGIEQKIDVIPGIELGVSYPYGKLHILGYFIDFTDENFQKQVNYLKTTREEKNNRFIEEFNKNGINICRDDLLKYSNNDVIGKPHFARCLLEKGYINNYEDAFKNYFNKEPYKSIKREPFTPKDAINMLESAGAVVIIAHPITLKLKGQELENAIIELKKLGVDGIECFNSIHTKEERDFLIDIANRNDLLVTAGSDYHGPNVKPNILLGSGKNNNIITDKPVVENLKIYKKIKSSL